MAFNHPKGLSWIDYDRKVIFVGIPKNASTSVRDSFSIKGNIININEQQQYLTDKTYSLITVIREPMSRIISGYAQIIKNAPNHIISRDFYLKRENVIESFKCFIDEVKIDGFFDAHIEKQWFYLTDEKNKLYPFDQIYIFEDMSNLDQFIQIKGKFGIKLKHANKSNGSQLNIKTKLLDFVKNDSYIANKIKKLYKEDFIFYEEKLNNNNQK